MVLLLQKKNSDQLPDHILFKQTKKINNSFNLAGHW